jgi:hypothetical protein
MKFFFFLVALFTPAITFASDPFPGIFSFAGCSGRDCSACNVVHMANEGITWLIGILFVIFAVLIAWRGVQLVTSSGNPSALSAVKESFVNALIGIIIILAAWLIVDTIMRALVGQPGEEGNLPIVVDGQVKGWLAWSEVECQVLAVPNFTPVEDSRVLTSSAPVPCAELYPGGPRSDCTAQVAACEATPGGVATQVGAAGSQSVVCETPIGINDPGTVTVPCDELYPGGPRSDCTAAEAACRADGGTPLQQGAAGSLNVACIPATPTAACRAGEMRDITLFGFSTPVHRSIATKLEAIDAAWRAQPNRYRVYSVGGYNCRTVAGSSSYSAHAFGLAVDINPPDNPHCPDKYDPKNLCRGNVTETNMPPEFRGLFLSRGFGWGGNWRSSKDAMHFSDAAHEGGSQNIR